MSTQELARQQAMTPETIASDLLNVIKDIERSITDSGDKTQAIESRGMFKSLFSSSKTDLVDISKSQNKINELMLGLIQEIITLNTMSYSFLAAVIGELEARTKTGWIDSEGRFQELSETGRMFASRAHDIFCKIAEGSKSTQTRIDLNKQDIDALKDQLSAKAEVVKQSREDIASIKTVLQHKTVVAAKQGEEIDKINSLLVTKTERLASIEKLLDSKTERLMSIDQMLASKAERLASIDRLLEAQNAVEQNQDLAIKQILAALEDGQRVDQQRLQDIRALEQALQAQANANGAAVAALQAWQAKALRGFCIAGGFALMGAGALAMKFAGVF